jgi:transcriptional regulator with XRE-family HTH domain
MSVSKPFRNVTNHAGTRVRNARLKAGLSQSQLAERIGVRQPRVCEIEASDHLRTDTALRLAKALDCTAGWLLAGRV